MLTPKQELEIRKKFGLDDGKYKKFIKDGEEKVTERQSKILSKLRRGFYSFNGKGKRLETGPITIKELKENEYISDEEKERLIDLENEIWNSDLIFKHDENSEGINFDTTKLSIISNIMENIENRREQDIAQKEQVAEQEREARFKNSIYALNLSSGGYRALRLARIETLDALKSLTYYELKNSRGIGPRYFEEIIKELSEQNIVLKGEDELTIDGEKPSDKVTLITKTNLSGRSANALRRVGITKLEQLSNFTYEEVKNFEGLGNQSFEEVIDILHEHGILLKDSGDKEIKKLISKKNELEIRLKELDEETRQCKELLDTYNKLIYGDKTNTEDEAPDFKDE